MAWRDADDGRSEAELLEARITEERSMARFGVEIVAKITTEGERDPV
jgi:hypothetical protein